MIFIDLQKAFNKVYWLFMKCCYENEVLCIVFSDDTIKWFLLNVNFENLFLDISSVICGIPEGLVLFFFYVNDIISYHIILVMLIIS